MKKQYNFSNGVKGKFYVLANEIESPIYLDKENQKYFQNLAKEKKVEISKLINKVLSKDRELIESVIAK